MTHPIFSQFGLVYMPHTFGQVWGLTLSCLFILIALVIDSYAHMSPSMQAATKKRLVLLGLGAGTLAAALIIIAPDCWYWFCW